MRICVYACVFVCLRACLRGQGPDGAADPRNRVRNGPHRLHSRRAAHPVIDFSFDGILFSRFESSVSLRGRHWLHPAGLGLVLRILS